MWIYVTIIPIAICLLGIPFFIKSGKEGKVFLTEYLLFIVPVLVWNFLTFNKVGSQSLSNIVEVYIVSIAVVAYSLFRFNRPGISDKAKMAWGLSLILLPIALRLLFPHLPE